jgi:hypothetical protein
MKKLAGQHNGQPPEILHDADGLMRDLEKLKKAHGARANASFYAKIGGLLPIAGLLVATGITGGPASPISSTMQSNLGLAVLGLVLSYLGAGISIGFAIKKKNETIIEGLVPNIRTRLQQAHDNGQLHISESKKGITITLAPRYARTTKPLSIEMDVGTWHKIKPTGREVQAVQVSAADGQALVTQGLSL